MIADMINNKKLNPVVSELFVRGRKLNISFIFIHSHILKYLKKLDSILHTFFIMKIPNERELQHFAINHSSDIVFQDFKMNYEKYTAEQYYFLVNETTLQSDNPLRNRKNLLELIYNK